MATISTFATEFGKIEITRDNDKGTYAGKAYFFGLDYGSDVDDAGQFADWFGRTFFITYDRGRYANEATLEILDKRTIATSEAKVLTNS